MIINFLIDNNGYIIKETLPINAQGQITNNENLFPVNYEWDSIKDMLCPKYNFSTKIFEDVSPDYDYYINLMNSISDPILKEEARLNAFKRIRLLAFFALWACTNNFEAKWKPINEIVDNISNNGMLLFFTDSGNNKMYKKSSNDVDNETQLTTFATGKPCYVDNNFIVFTKTSGLLFKKSINDIDNETVLTTFVCTHPVYVGNNKIIFLKADNCLYMKNINDIDNETQLTTHSVIASYCYIGNETIVYTKLSTGSLYKKSIKDIDNETVLTTYICAHVIYIGNQELCFQKEPLGVLCKKSTADIDNEIQLTDYETPYLCYIGNKEICFTKNNKLYKKSVNDFNNEKMLTSYNISTVTSAYIPMEKYYNQKYRDYYITKIEIQSFLKNINFLYYGTAEQLSDFYTDTQTLRSKYNISALQNLNQVPELKNEDYIFIQQLEEILSGS